DIIDRLSESRLGGLAPDAMHAATSSSANFFDPLPGCVAMEHPETNPTYGQIRYADQNRSLASYLTDETGMVDPSVTLTSDSAYNELILRLRNMDRSNWDPRLSAYSITHYLIDGFKVQ